MRRSALALRTALNSHRAQSSVGVRTPASVLATDSALPDAWDSNACLWRCQQRRWSNWGNQAGHADSAARLTAPASSAPLQRSGSVRHAVGASAGAAGGASYGLERREQDVQRVWTLSRRALHTDSQRLLHVSGAAAGLRTGVPASRNAGGADGGADAAHDGDADGRDALDAADFRARGLSPLLVRSLEKAGVAELFPVQIETLQSSMAGEDLIVRSRTGTGKTLAFVLPIAELLLRDGSKRATAPRALVLAPTRELAIQVAGEFQRFAPFLRTTTVYGGVSSGPQIRDLRSGVDVVVGTPGRVVDLKQQGVLRLESVKAFVLDEADEMLDMGFADQLEEVMRTLPSKEDRQTMLWSATVPSWVRQVSKRYLREPKLIDLVESAPTLPSNLTNVAVAAHGGAITEVTCRVIAAYSGRENNGKATRCLAFCNTKVEVQRMAQAVAKMPGVRSAGLSGDLSQQQREKVLADFRAGRVTCVFATDVAARGLDIPNVETVVHVRPATQLSAFTHRSGRTARAGADGTNVVVFSPRDPQDCERLASFQEALECEFKVVGVPKLQDETSAVEDSKRKLRSAAMASATTSRQAQTDALLQYLTKIEPDTEAQVQLLAKALLYTPDEESYSLLSGEQGFVTVMLDQGSPDRRGDDTQRVLRDGGLEADIVPEWRSFASGAVFDIPQRLWPKVEAAIGHAITAVDSLPSDLAFGILPGVPRKGRGPRGRPPPQPARSLVEALRGMVPGNSQRQQQWGRGGGRGGRGGRGGGGGGRRDAAWGDGGWGGRGGGGGGGRGGGGRGGARRGGGRGGRGGAPFADAWLDDRRGGGQRQGRGGGGGGGGGRRGGGGGDSWGGDSGRGGGGFGFDKFDKGMKQDIGRSRRSGPPKGSQDDFSFGAYRR